MVAVEGEMPAILIDNLKNGKTDPDFQACLFEKQFVWPLMKALIRDALKMK